MTRAVLVGAVLRSRRLPGREGIELVFISMAIVSPRSEYGTALVLRARADAEGGDVTVLDGRLVRP